MIKGLYSSSNGMPPMLVRMEVIANNLANMNTSGFKRDGMFIQMMKDPGIAPEASSGELTTRLNVERTINFGEGNLNSTGNPLDLAVQGKGYFVVQTPQGERYTRNGNFSIALDGTLTTNEGYPVAGVEGRIRFPDLERVARESIAISQTGEINIGKTPVGKLRVIEFQDETKLRKAGNSFFTIENGAASLMKESEMPMIRQGFLEESNVDGLSEMIEMIEITRHFESNQKAIASQDATLDKVLEIAKW